MQLSIWDWGILSLTGLYFSSRLNDGKNDTLNRAVIGVTVGGAAAYFGPDVYKKVKGYLYENTSDKILKLGMAATAAGITYSLSDKILDSINNLRNQKQGGNTTL